MLERRPKYRINCRHTECHKESQVGAGMMAELRQRAANRSDLQAIGLLISDAWTHEGPRSEMHIGDLYWACFSKRTAFDRCHPCVWETQGGSIVGFTMVSNAGWCDLVVHPDYDAVDFVPAALRRAEKHVRNQPHQCSDLRFGRRVTNSNVESVLTRLGFTRMKFGYPTLQRTLEEGQTAACNIGDLMISRGNDVTLSHSQRATAWNEAFPLEPRRESDIASLTEAPGFCDKLDFTCHTNDGIIAAFCTVWFDEITKSGLFEPVGTTPQFQRRGLASAIVQAASNQLYTIGGKTAFVRVHNENTTAAKFYTAVGFRPASSAFGFEKQLDAHHDA